MTDGRYAKPGAATPGFARLLWQALASFDYLVALAGASACFPLWPVAVDGAGGVVALLWGGLQ